MNPLFTRTCGLLVFSLGIITYSSASARSASPKEKDIRPSETHKSDNGYETHKVRKGETLWSIAMEYNTSAGEIMDLNHMDSNRVKDGSTLKIPHAGGPSNVIQSGPTKTNIHIVEQGETFSKIARFHEVSEAALQRANPKVDPEKLRSGTRLNLPSAERSNVASESKVVPSGKTYIVRDNETFSSIAKKQGIKTDDLMAANPTIKPERLYEGLTLKLPGSRVAPQTADKSKVAKPSAKTQQESTSERAVVNQSEKSDKKAPTKDAPTKPKTEVATNKPTPKTEKPESKTEAKPEQHKAETEPDALAGNHVIRSYIVSNGETVETIAEAFHTSPKKVREYNKLDASSKLRAGDEIMVPTGTTVAKR